MPQKIDLPLWKDIWCDKLNIVQKYVWRNGQNGKLLNVQ